MSEKPQFHGSDLELIEKYYGIPKEQIISFSANINPLGLSPLFREHLRSHIDAAAAYPDREYTALRESICAYCGAPKEHLLLGSGATELISRFIKIIEPKRALIVGPTYSEYERELKLNGGQLRSYYLPEDQEFVLNIDDLLSHLTRDCDLLILCNPNNPTGSALHHKELHAVLAHCEQAGIPVMIDETYVEFAEDMEDITAVSLTGQYGCLLVLRGISKFFAAPGLRLGYAVTGNPRLLAEINDSKIPWAINSYAAGSGSYMFLDHAYIDATRRFIREERQRLLSLLRKEPFLHVYEPSANFILMKVLKPGLTSGHIFDSLIREGLMIRDCSSFTGLSGEYIRFCFSTKEHNDRLLAVLTTLLHPES